MLGIKLRWPLIKKASAPVEEKSWLSLGDVTNFLETYDHNDLAAFTSIHLANKTAPVANAVNIIAKEISSLIPKVINKKDEVIPNHPVLELLKTPNSDSTTSELLYAITAFFLITGNTYLVCTGQKNKPPLELMTVFPQQISIQSDNRDSWAQLIIYNSIAGNFIFTREEVKKRFRFYHRDEQEIWQIKRFNPNLGSLFGQSLLSPIYAEIDQYNYSSIHNTNLLRRGGRPSGILMMNALGGGADKLIPPLTDEQRVRLEAQVRNFVGGAQNAGKILVAAGANMKWENLITTNRDMDFAVLKSEVKNTIYTHFGIPLPFINPERQTFANMGLAKEQLYDNVIFNLADRIFTELDIFLMPRYGRFSEDLRLTYDKSAISALKNRKAREVELLQKLGIFTDNELRALLGKEPYVGGDVIYKTGNMVAVGEDAYTGDEPPVPKTTKKRFSEIMAAKGYSEDKIEELAAVYRLR